MNFWLKIVSFSKWEIERKKFTTEAQRHGVKTEDCNIRKVKLSTWNATQENAEEKKNTTGPQPPSAARKRAGGMWVLGAVSKKIVAKGKNLAQSGTVYCPEFSNCGD
jgi:hypothetical protein